MRFSIQQTVVSLSLAVVGMLAPNRMPGQALQTGVRTSEVAVFGGISGGMPDYLDSKNFGGSAGVMFTHYFNFPVAPSLIARGDYNVGREANEQSVKFGLRLQTDLKTRFHPYVNVLTGGGVIKFSYPPSPGFSGDRGSVVSFGGGVDLDLTTRLQAKADFLQEHWNFGLYNPYGTRNGDYVINPRNLMVGFVYRIPFKPHVSKY